LLVEGRTEKLAFPFIFRALGHDVDREAITIVECGGKPNMPIFIRICQAAGIPFLAVHDSDARAHGRPSRGERRINAQLGALAGAGHTTMLAPDFEAVAGLHGHHHKPTRAWQRFSAAAPDSIPEPLRRIVETILDRAGTSRITS
jgi:hypothetical protein